MAKKAAVDATPGQKQITINETEFIRTRDAVSHCFLFLWLLIEVTGKARLTARHVANSPTASHLVAKHADSGCNLVGTR